MSGDDAAAVASSAKRRTKRVDPIAPSAPDAASQVTTKPTRAASNKARSATSKTGRERRPRAKVTREAAAEIFRRLSQADPEPQSELEYVNPFTLLVAVVLSAQATDAGVNKATRPLFQRASTPQSMLALGEDDVREAIKTIGLYRNKAKNVIALCRALIDQHDGEVPEDRDALEALPGVGRKTANVVMNVAFQHPTMAVDTHVFRVANRTGLAPGKTPLDVEDGLLRIIPEAYALNAHHWLILHGRYVCKARKPDCPNCAIRDLCAFKEKTQA